MHFLGFYLVISANFRAVILDQTPGMENYPDFWGSLLVNKQGRFILPCIMVPGIFSLEKYPGKDLTIMYLENH